MTAVTELFVGVISVLVAGLVIWGLGRLVFPGRQHMTTSWVTLGVVAGVALLLGGFLAVMLDFGAVLTFLVQATLTAVGTWLVLRVRGYPSR